MSGTLCFHSCSFIHQLSVKSLETISTKGHSCKFVLIPSSCLEGEVLTSKPFRIAARLKGIAFQTWEPPGKLYEDAYQSINPNATLPTLIADYNNGQSVTLTQSLNMLEFLEESYPGTIRLIPPVTDMASRVKARDLAAFIACDVQPFLSKRILSQIEGFGQDSFVFGRSLLGSKMRVYEDMVENHAGRFSVGDELSIADICLVTTVQAASKFGLTFRVKKNPYTIIERIVRECENIPVFREDGVPRIFLKESERPYRSSSLGPLQPSRFSARRRHMGMGKSDSGLGEFNEAEEVAGLDENASASLKPERTPNGFGPRPTTRPFESDELPEKLEDLLGPRARAVFGHIVSDSSARSDATKEARS